MEMPKTITTHVRWSFSNLTVTELSCLASQCVTQLECSPAPAFCWMKQFTT